MLRVRTSLQDQGRIQGAWRSSGNASLMRFLWTPSYREECGLSKVRVMEVGDAWREPDHDSNGALQTSGVEGASNELGVSETMSRSIRDRFLTKETEASETHTFYTKDKLNLWKTEPLQPRRTYQLYNAHSLPGPPLSSSPASSQPLGRCEVFYFLTRTNSRHVTYPFCLAKQIISTLHAYSKLGIFVNNSNQNKLQ